MPLTAAERAAKDLEKANATVESLSAKHTAALEKLDTAQSTVDTLGEQLHQATAIRDHLATHPALPSTAPTVAPQSGEAAPDPVPTAAGLPVAEAPFDPFS